MKRIGPVFAMSFGMIAMLGSFAPPPPPEDFDHSETMFAGMQWRTVGFDRAHDDVWSLLAFLAKFDVPAWFYGGSGVMACYTKLSSVKRAIAIANIWKVRHPSCQLEVNPFSWY